MFNRELHNKFTEELKQYCEGKRVLLVGNAASLFNHEYGDLIDSYDVVVRFGKGIPFNRYKKHLGSKTDVWFFGPLRATSYPNWKCKFKIFNYMQISMYDVKSQLLTIPNCMTTDELQMYKDYFTVGTFSEHLHLINKIHEQPFTKKSERLSQGSLAFLYFDEIIKTQSQLDLVGFDFFSSEVKFEHGGNQKVVGSWHIPIPIHNADQLHPHAGLKEKNYILKRSSESNETIKVHQMNSEITTKINEMLMKEFRPTIK
jgi:hypothetical protein